MKNLWLCLIVIGVSGCTLSFPFLTPQEPRILMLAPEHARHNAHSLFLLGKLQLEHNKPAEACVTFKRVIKIQPDYVEAYVGLGSAYRQLKKYNRSLKAYDTALKLEPENKQARLGKAAVYLNLGKFSQVRETLQPLLEKEPQNYEALRLSAYAYYFEGNYTAAEQQMKQALQQAPKEEDTTLKLIYNDLLQYLQKYGEKK
ncbi:MAG: tetratricopeptide repeat protein [Candidatus Sumerlaeia bacterium]|nr:tetratricopeptide repeat protein [Candidatus Sumerlaeia bacterium]